MRCWVWGRACLALAPACSRCGGLSNLFLRGSFAARNLPPLTPQQLAGEGPMAGSKERNLGCSEETYKGLPAQRLGSPRKRAIVL